MPVITLDQDTIEDAFAARLEGLDVTDYVQGANTSADVKMRRSRRPFHLVGGDVQAHLEFLTDVEETSNTDDDRSKSSAWVISRMSVLYAYKVRADTALADKRLAQHLARRVGAACNDTDSRWNARLVTPYRARWATGGEYLLVEVVVEVSHDYDLTVA